MPTIYDAGEIEGFAVDRDALDQCDWLPIVDFAGQTNIQLRLAPARNNQQRRLK